MKERDLSKMTRQEQANLAATLVFLMLGREALEALADELRRLG